MHRGPGRREGGSCSCSERSGQDRRGSFRHAETDWGLTTGAKGGEGARGNQAVRLMPGTPENSPSSQSNAGSGGRIARLRTEHWPRLHKPRAASGYRCGLAEGIGSTSRLSRGFQGVATASGRRPPAQVTDPPYNLMERKKLSSLSLLCS